MKYQNNAIGDENSRKLFDVKLQFSKHEIMDQIKFEYKSYQIENIPDNYYELPVDKDQNVKLRCPSYWRDAYNSLNIDITPSENKYCGIDEYWLKV